LAANDVERYTRPSIEDIELGYRLREAGGKIRLIPQLQCTHLKVWHFFNLIHTEIFCRAIPWSRLMLSRTEIIDDLNISLGERARGICWCIVAGIAACGNGSVAMVAVIVWIYDRNAG